MSVLPDNTSSPSGSTKNSISPLSTTAYNNYLNEIDPHVREIILVIGAGSFGTALAEAAARADNEVRLFARDIEQVNTINETRINKKIFPDVELNPNITAYYNLLEAIKNVNIIILALPAQIIPVWLEEHRHVIPTNAILVNTAKGLCLAKCCLLSEAIEDALGRSQTLVILSGPSFAREIIEGKPTAVLLASKRLLDAGKVRKALASSNFHLHLSTDVVGAELGGALKNPLAIGAGIIQGRQMGINALAAYLTRSGEELQALCSALGGDPLTIAGLAGIGDLILTSFGELSRNRSLGIRLSRGEKIEDITKVMTVEGVPTARVAVLLARRVGLAMPIFNTVHALLEGKLSIEDAHHHIMGSQGVL